MSKVCTKSLTEADAESPPYCILLKLCFVVCNLVRQYFKQTKHNMYSRWSMTQTEQSSSTWDWPSSSDMVSTLPWTWGTRPTQPPRCCRGAASGTSAQTCGPWVRSSLSSVPGFGCTRPVSVPPRSRRPCRISHTATLCVGWWRLTLL